MFGQTFELHDLLIVGLLIVLEGVLSIDNALVLGLLAKRLPKHLQHKALTYGLVGAFVFRFIAIGAATLLIQLRFVKLLGGLYLAYVSLKHFVFELKEAASHQEEHISVGPNGTPVLINPATRQPLSEAEEDHELRERISLPAGRRLALQFWTAVLVIEVTDIAFAVDSILAAVGLVAGRDKTWVVITGGFLGVILMRFAAAVFIKLLEKFPRFETAAYLLVLVIGTKLVIDWGFNRDPHAPVIDFHHPSSPAFWVLWLLMLACFCVGFIPRRHQPVPAS